MRNAKWIVLSISVMAFAVFSNVGLSSEEDARAGEPEIAIAGVDVSPSGVKDLDEAQCRQTIKAVRGRITDLPKALKSARIDTRAARKMALETNEDLQPLVQEIEQLKQALQAKESELESAIESVPEVKSAADSEVILRKELQAAHELHASLRNQLRQLLWKSSQEKKSAE